MLASSLLVLALHVAPPSLSDRLTDTSSRIGLLSAAETKATQQERLKVIDEQLGAAPRGWPVGSVVGAAVGFSLGGAMVVTALVIMFALTGAEGAGVVLGVIVALAAVIPLTVGIVFAIVGASVARERQNTIEQLENERRGLVENEAAASGPWPGLVLARF